MKSICGFLLALAGAVSAVAGPDEVEITGAWTVVYPDWGPEARGLTSAARDAANTVSDVLGEALGERPKVVIGGKDPAGPGRRILIGGPFAEQAGLMPADFQGWDWGIAEKDGDIYCFGRDRTGSHPQYETGCVNPSALAAIRFLRDRVGVLFLMPGKVGREVPKLDRLAVPKGFSARGSVKAPYQSGRGYDYPYNLANCIYGSGAFHSYGGHTYGPACPNTKYFKTNPEYFAKNEKGEPIWNEHYQAYCISNPGFRKLLVEELCRRYDAGADVCQLGQNDGGQAICKCKACHDLYGTGDDWCEKMWLFHLDIAREMLTLRPGKLVHIMCYGDTANPPKTAKVFPENVLVEICRYGEEDMRKWDGYTVPHGFTYYIYNWSWYPILGFTPKRSIAGLVDQVNRFHRYGMKGIYRCGFGEMFGMEGPAYWVYNHLVEDPEADVKAALATYYRGAFGPAAEPMRRFYEDLEKPLAEVERRNSTKASDLVESTIRRTKRRDPVSALATVYTPERVARMDAALRAAEAAEGLSAKQVRRLQLVRTEWTYVRNVGTIANLYDAYRERPTKALCERIVALVKVRNEIIGRLFPDGKARTVKGWPELALFGRPPVEQFRENGRLGAPIKEPLNWDVERMTKYGVLPMFRMEPGERAKEVKAAGVRPLTGFKPAAFPKGSMFKPYPDGTGFSFGQGTNTHVSVTARIGKDQGLEPGKAYRITWLTRWEHVNVDKPWRGYYFCATRGPRTPTDKNLVQVPVPPLHSGTSAGWVRESALLEVCDKPGFTSEFTFRFWGGADGVAEVRDVTIEEVKVEQ